jgi:hypothetical protein
MQKYKMASGKKVIFTEKKPKMPSSNCQILHPTRAYVLRSEPLVQNSVK